MISAICCLACSSNKILLTSFCLPARKNSVLMNGYFLLNAVKYICNCGAVADVLTTILHSFLAPAMSCSKVCAAEVPTKASRKRIAIIAVFMTPPLWRTLVEFTPFCQRQCRHCIRFLTEFTLSLAEGVRNDRKTCSRPARHRLSFRLRGDRARRQNRKIPLELISVR